MKKICFILFFLLTFPAFVLAQQSLTIYAKENEKYMLDLKELNKLILLNAGIPEENIDVSDMCTKCEDELFFSYRRQGEKAGRNASFIMKG